MTEFVNGEADVLLSTTIIESGLDIPNANTIIIDRADRFGLSDLYQLRGRVGRYKHQAYAYLLLPRHASLLTDVRKRISAIKQYSTLGSGFKIAMRDLEIRGAGNLLGADKAATSLPSVSSFTASCSSKASRVKGEKMKPRVEVSVQLDFLQSCVVRASRPGAGSPVNHRRASGHRCRTTTSPNRSIASKFTASWRRPRDKLALENLEKRIARPLRPAAASGGIAAASGRT